mmetsp:Transcript_37088/g.106168  ORF Transcript_37088/g.106168 Transcript_37088/m.106168 type:complete len:247 (+) Transcript_37088:903-1643(+)
MRRKKDPHQVSSGHMHVARPCQLLALPLLIDSPPLLDGDILHHHAAYVTHGRLLDDRHDALRHIVGGQEIAGVGLPLLPAPSLLALPPWRRDRSRVADAQLDSGAGEVLPRGVDKPFNGIFGCAVDGGLLARAQAEHTRRHDDLPRAARLHQRQQLAHEQEHTFDVGLHNEVKVLDGRLVDCARSADAGVEYGHVRGPPLEVTHTRIHQPLAVPLVANITNAVLHQTLVVLELHVRVAAVLLDIVQ